MSNSRGQASLNNTGAAVYGSKVGLLDVFRGITPSRSFSDIGAFCSIAPHVIIGGESIRRGDFVTTCTPTFTAHCAIPGARSRVRSSAEMNSPEPISAMTSG